MSEAPNEKKLQFIEYDAIRDALKECGGNRTHAAKQLGISLRCLRNKIGEMAHYGYLNDPNKTTLLEKLNSKCKEESKKAYEKLSIRYKKEAKYKGYEHEKEDFCAYAIERLLSGSAATPAQLLSDYIRTQYGHSRTPSGLLRSKNIRFTEEFDGSRSEHQNGNGRNSPTSRSDIADGEKILSATLSQSQENNYSDQIDRCIYILREMWGFTNVEIAHCFGIDESRVSQRYQGIQSRISKVVKSAANPRTETKTERQFQEVYSEKGQGIQPGPHQEMASKKPREMASSYEESFSEWLT